ncbi:hypothetical protein ACK3SF_05235 [Candidatus Nanosalina sp. VS9-1]|uniref:hypothetical protein n=1 Tax=Candidatus Nanosalina sp. VS9-1 TaxID=3388566 RepID=UPI0039E03B1C
MERAAFLIISLAIVVSGCTGGGSNASEKSVTCSSMHLKVVAADGSEAQVRNLGDGSYGNVTVSWDYYNSGFVQKEFPAPEAGKTVSYESGDSGPVRSVEVQHNDCPSRRGSFP